jgi:GNAT superfamily N-acetyltransferase
MYIKPGFRSNNIGSQIITDIKHIGKEKAWTRIDVTAPTEERWVRTVDFYKRCGFVFTGPKLKLIL